MPPCHPDQTGATFRYTTATVELAHTINCKKPDDVSRALDALVNESENLEREASEASTRVNAGKGKGKGEGQRMHCASIFVDKGKGKKGKGQKGEGRMMQEMHELVSTLATMQRMGRMGFKGKGKSHENGLSIEMILAEMEEIHTAWT